MRTLVILALLVLAAVLGLAAGFEGKFDGRSLLAILIIAVAFAVAVTTPERNHR